MVKEYLQNKNFPFWLFTISVLSILTIHQLIKDGMFLDGMLYTCVSHNLSNGIGSFWFPEYSPSYMNAGSHFFLEHPPLVFGIQSLFFKLFGDSMYVERFYIFLTMCITAFSIHILWNTIFRKEKELKKISWLPILFWITIPACSWSYTNNMMENTMGIFTLCAVILIFKSLESDKNEYTTLILSGILIFLATMSKGIPGFFPVSVPFLYWITFRKKSLLKVFFQTFIILSVPVLFYLILFNLPHSHESLTFYVTKRLLGRIHDDPTVGNRLYIMKRLFTELLPQIILTILVISVAKLKKTNVALINNIRVSSFFFLIGLSASIPLALTMVQRGFYLVPSFPYFAISLSILIAPVVLKIVENLYDKKQNFKIYRILSIVFLLFAITISLMQKGKAVRDKDILHDVYTIGKTIPGKSAITVNQDIANTCVLECYFIRYYNISLYVDIPKEYLMVKKTEKLAIPEEFEKLNIDTKIYDVYKARPKNSE
jgi:4-amino-4-deoxy-L-arabinose transferase-like glycosyltransferase